MMLDAVYNVVCKRLASSSHSLIGFDKERSYLSDLIKRTATEAESNSLLIIGRRGVGKTKLVNTVISDMEPSTAANVMLVHLNGLLQLDDRVALQEVTKQLGLDSQVAHRVFSSFSENFRFLLDLLRRGNKTSKSVVFVIEEFDLFAQHKNQTLLYNLFDVCQSACTPVCVLGITARLDVVELLEKRVKSRFSHRQLLLCSPCNTFDDYVQAAWKLLSLPDGRRTKDAGYDVDSRSRTKWNASIDNLMDEEVFLSALKTQFLIRKDIRGLKQLLLLSFANLSTERSVLQASDFLESVHLMKQDSKANLLRGLSVLELSLMVALVKLTETYDGDPVNFEMVYNEYCRFCRDRCSSRAVEKTIAAKAFAQLQAQELVRFATAQASSAHQQLLRNFHPVYSLVSAAQLDNCFEFYPQCPTELQQWAKSEHLVMN